MKKVWSLCVLLIALFVVCSLPVLADETDGTVEFILGEGNLINGISGEQIEIPLYVQGGDSYNSVGLALKYDGSEGYDISVLKLVGIVPNEEILKDCYSLGEDGYLASFDVGMEAIVLGLAEAGSWGEKTKICTLQFEILKGAEPGDTEVDIHSFVKMNSTPVSSSVTPATVTIGDETPAGITLSGKVTSYGDAEEVPTIRLLNGENEVATATITDGTYTLTAPAGTYTLEVSKTNHVTRTYDVTLRADAETLDVKIHLIGDVSGDGKVNLVDYGKALSHAKGSVLLTDYAFDCANVNGDSKVNLVDYGRILSHAKGTSSLWS